MNASPYRGIAPRQTAAQRERRALVARIGHDAVAQQDADRIDYYRALIAQARSKKAL
jgi:hypothetical protein